MLSVRHTPTPTAKSLILLNFWLIKINDNTDPEVDDVHLLCTDRVTMAAAPSITRNVSFSRWDGACLVRIRGNATYLYQQICRHELTDGGGW